MSIDMKVMVVGDSGVGKTCLIISYTSNTFPTDYVPTVFDNYNTSVIIEDKTIALGLWDTAGSDEYDSLRPLSYPGTDVFLVCFSLIEPETLTRVRTKWIPEIRAHIEGANPAILLLGTKLDQRGNAQVIETLRSQGLHPVTTREGEQMCQELGADGYFECSALTQAGLPEVFNAAVRHVLPETKIENPKVEEKHPHGKKGEKGGKDCVIM